MGRRANSTTLQAVRGTNLVDPQFMEIYEEIIKHESGITGGDLDYVFQSQKAHTYCTVFRQYGMIERIGRQQSKHSRGIGWAYVATDVVPTQPIGWGAQKKPQTKAVKADIASNGHLSTRKLWTTIRKNVLKHYEPTLAGISPKAVQFVLRDIATDIDTLQATVAHRIISAAERLDTPDRRQIRNACEVLGISPPRAGKPIDFTQARRRMHLLAREYHPDLHDGDTHKAELFARVNDAFRVIERFQASSETTTERS